MSEKKKEKSKELELPMRDIIQVVNQISQKEMQGKETLLDRNIPGFNLNIALIIQACRDKGEVYNNRLRKEQEKRCERVDDKLQYHDNGSYKIDPAFQSELAGVIEDMQKEKVKLGVDRIDFDLKSDAAKQLTPNELLTMMKFVIKEG